MVDLTYFNKSGFEGIRFGKKVHLMILMKLLEEIGG